MDQYSGLMGFVTILGLVYALSNCRRAIDWRLVVCGLSLQVFLAIFVLGMPWGNTLFEMLGRAIESLLGFSNRGASFVLGPLNDTEKMRELFGPGGGFIFVFKLIPTLIFVSSLSSLAYHLGLMQRLVAFIAWVIYRIMGASGSEATSNAASVFVGMLEAQLLIRPFLATATQSELLAILAGSMACISGGIMAVYIQMGIAAEFMMAASVMAIPGALVIAKMMYPEREESTTREGLKLDMESKSVNVLDAVAVGAVEGLKVGAAASAVLVAVLALIAMLDAAIAELGTALARTFFDFPDSASLLGMNLNALSLSEILGALFFYPAVLLGVPLSDAASVGGLMGTKLVVNEFVAYSQLAPQIESASLHPKSVLIATFALCGFANFGSVAILIGGVGGMVPERKADLARLGLRAMVCGTLASYLSACLAGLIYVERSVGDGDSLLGPSLVLVLCAGIIAVFTFKNRASRPRPIISD